MKRKDKSQVGEHIRMPEWQIVSNQSLIAAYERIFVVKLTIFLILEIPLSISYKHVSVQVSNGFRNENAVKKDKPQVVQNN